MEFYLMYNWNIHLSNYINYIPSFELNFRFCRRIAILSPSGVVCSKNISGDVYTSVFTKHLYCVYHVAGVLDPPHRSVGANSDFNDIIDCYYCRKCGHSCYKSRPGSYGCHRSVEFGVFYNNHFGIFRICHCSQLSQATRKQENVVKRRPGKAGRIY